MKNLKQIVEEGKVLGSFVQASPITMGFIVRLLVFFLSFLIAIVSLVLILFCVHSPAHPELAEQYDYLSETIAAILGATVAFLWPTYRYWVESPDLEIIWKPEENHDLYTPSNSVKLDSVPDEYLPEITVRNNRIANRTNIAFVERQHLRVLVRNTGQKTAKSCTATIHIEKDGKLSGCMAFSTEPKPLRWVSSIGAIETAVDIPPYGGEQALDVIFSDNFGPYSILDRVCKVDNSSDNKAPLRAYAATPTAYRYPWMRNQDGFCMGRFNVAITIYCQNSRPKIGHYTLQVGDRWNEVIMEER